MRAHDISKQRAKSRPGRSLPKNSERRVRYRNTVRTYRDPQGCVKVHKYLVGQSLYLVPGTAYHPAIFQGPRDRRPMILGSWIDRRDRRVIQTCHHLHNLSPRDNIIGQERQLVHTCGMWWYHQVRTQQTRQFIAGLWLRCRCLGRAIWAMACAYYSKYYTIIEEGWKIHQISDSKAAVLDVAEWALADTSALSHFVRLFV